MDRHGRGQSGSPEKPGSSQNLSVSRTIWQAMNVLQPYPCPWQKCSVILNCYVHFKKHIVQIHCSKSPYKCKWGDCQEEHPRASLTLEEHIKSMHYDSIRYPCPMKGCRFESQRRSLQIHVRNLHRNQHEQKNTATLQTPAPRLVDAPVNHSEQVPAYLLGAPRVRASSELSDNPTLRLCGKPILGIGNASRKRNPGKFRTTIIKRTALDTDDDDKDQCPPLDDLSDETPRSILVHPSRTRKVMRYLSVPPPFEPLALTNVLQVAPMVDSLDNRNNLLFRRDTTERIIAMQLEGVRCHHSMY